MTNLLQLLAALCTIWIGPLGPTYHQRIRQLGGERHLRRIEVGVNIAADVARVPPHVLAFVAHAESGLDPRRVSRTGAEGLMQLQPGTTHHSEWRAACRLEPGGCTQANLVVGARFLRRCWEICGAGWGQALGRYRGVGCVAREGEERLAAAARRWAKR